MIKPRFLVLFTPSHHRLRFPEGNLVSLYSMATYLFPPSVVLLTFLELPRAGKQAADHSGSVMRHGGLCGGHQPHEPPWRAQEFRSLTLCWFAELTTSTKAVTPLPQLTRQCCKVGRSGALFCFQGPASCFACSWCSKL